MAFREVLPAALAAVVVLPAATPAPHLGGGLPQAESKLAAALAPRTGPVRLVRVLVETNGWKTVAGVSLAYPVRVADPVRLLRRVSWELSGSAFRALPQLDEVNVTAFHEAPAAPAHRRDVTFTAAVSRAEWEASRDRRDVHRLPERVWFHPALRLPPGERREAAVARYARSASPPPARREPVLARWLEAAARILDRIAGPLRRLLGAAHAPPKVYRGTGLRPLVALTFDDGPVPVYTPLLLNTLENLGVRATFFLIGFRAEQYPYWVRAIAEAGHEVGNHGYTHADLTALPRDTVRQELVRTNRALHRTAGSPPRYFRPPGGRVNSTVIREAARAGLVTVLWSIAPGDHASPGPQVVAGRLRAVRAGDVVLLHQGIQDTLRVLPQVVLAWRARGLEPAPVGEVLGEEEPS